MITRCRTSALCLGCLSHIKHTNQKSCIRIVYLYFLPRPYERIISIGPLGSLGAFTRRVYFSESAGTKQEKIANKYIIRNNTVEII